MKRQVFYSFHYDNDVFRVQQIRNIGAIEGNTPVSPNDWEKIWRAGNSAIQRWIDENMKYRSCVVVLVGAETANRPWVKYEIQKAWNDGKGLVGIYIHKLKCPKTGTCVQGPNPFDQFNLDTKSLFGPRKLSSIVKCHTPSIFNAYKSIADNLDVWVDEAIHARLTN